MNAAMMVQIDEFGGFCSEANRRFDYDLTTGDKCDDGSVMVGVTSAVENNGSRHGRYRALKRLYARCIPAF
jgi:hypothetical protein